VRVREWVSLNGRLTSAEQAQVSVFDSGLMQGIGLFETLRTYSGRVFRLDAHLERLAASAEKLGWTTRPSIDECRFNVNQVVAATEQAAARVRLTVTTGSLRHGEADAPQLTIIASATPGAEYPSENYARGVTAIWSTYRQSRFDPIVGHKTVSYFSRLMSLREAHAHSALESIWLNDDGSVAEGAISNIFCVIDDELVTPPLDTPVLPGIARAAVIDIARALKISVREEAIEPDLLLAADEVFLTNSLMQVMPVVRIERKALGAEHPGDVTRQMIDSYAELIREECEDE
jgi:branched-chain amino acid aminotransferase